MPRQKAEGALPDLRPDHEAVLGAARVHGEENGADRDWRDMSEAPLDRAIYLTADPAASGGGVLSYRRTTREKINGRKGWHARSFWASVLTRRELDFVPYCWRESIVVAERGGVASAEVVA